MHNILVYLFKLRHWFIFYPTCLGSNYAIIKGATSDYIRFALKCVL
jgi:hypothetical protein